MSIWNKVKGQARALWQVLGQPVLFVGGIPEALAKAPRGVGAPGQQHQLAGALRLRTVADRAAITALEWPCPRDCGARR
jgi:hypothetical protein